MKRILFSCLVILLMVNLNGYSQPTITVATPSTALNCGSITLSQSSAGTHKFTFSASGYASGVTIYVTVYGGWYDFTVSKSSSSGFGTGLTFTCDGSGAIATTDIYVKFTPTIAGLQRGYAITVYDEETGIENFEEKRVQGTGLVPEIDLQFLGVSIASGKTLTETKDNTDYGSVSLNTEVDVSYTILNVSTATGDLLLSGSPIVELVNATNFTVQSQPANTTITKGDSTTFTIRFKPTSAGTKTATVRIYNNDANEGTYTFNISGTGVALEPEIDLKYGAVSIASGKIITEATDKTFYGSVSLNTDVDVTYTIENTATGSTAGNLLLSGTPIVELVNATNFTVHAQPSLTTIAKDGGTTTFTIRFTPTTSGVKTATVRIYNNDANEGTYTFNISGTGIVLEPEINLKYTTVSIASGKTITETTDATYYGSVSLNTSVDVTYTIENTATGSSAGDLLLTGTPVVELVNATNFTVHSQPGKTTIAKDGDNTTFTVRFTPTTAGTKTATIRIYNNDANEGTYTFNISGDGAASIPTISSTTAITNRTVSSASSGGNITSNGGASVSQRGVSWSTSANPDPSEDPFSNDGAGNGVFTSTITGGLSAATKYYVRAYAINTAGTGYGNELEFWTLDTEPSTNAATIVVDDKGTITIDLSWTAASGADGYIVLQRSGATAPTNSGVVDGVKYSSWTLPVGTTVSGEVATNSIKITGLSSGTQYSFLVIAFGKGSDNATYNYKTDATLPSLTVTTLLAAPTIQASNLVWETLNASTMGFSWNQGNGAGSIFLMRAGAAPSLPVNGTSYTHTNNFSTAPTLADGETKVIFFGDINAKAMLEVTNLSNLNKYYFTVLGYNGTGSDVSYNIDRIAGHNVGNNDGSALPIELFSFTAMPINGKVNINWITASEVNNDFFSLERSANMLEWENIYQTPGAGTSNSMIEYTTADNTPLSGLSYYRLKQTDFDGQFTYSDPKSVSNGTTNLTSEVVVTNGYLQTSIMNLDGKPIIVEIFNMTGQRMFAEKYVPIGNAWQLTIPFKEFSNGMYILKLNTGKEVNSHKFIF